MDTKKLIEILDKNVNQQQLAKDLAVELVLPYVEKLLEGVDLIPGTTIDQDVLKSVLAFVKQKVAA